MSLPHHHFPQGQEIVSTPGFKAGSFASNHITGELFAWEIIVVVCICLRILFSCFWHYQRYPGYDSMSDCSPQPGTFSYVIQAKSCIMYCPTVSKLKACPRGLAIYYILVAKSPTCFYISVINISEHNAKTWSWAHSQTLLAVASGRGIVSEIPCFHTAPAIAWGSLASSLIRFKSFKRLLM